MLTTFQVLNFLVKRANVWRVHRTRHITSHLDNNLKRFAADGVDNVTMETYSMRCTVCIILTL